MEAEADAEEEWVREVVKAHERMLFRRSKGWFTGYNSNVEGHEHGKTRYFVYNGGGPRYWRRLQQTTGDNYNGIGLD